MVSSVFFPTDEEFNLSLTPHRQRRESVDLVLDDTHSSPRISPGGTSVSTVDSNGYDNQKPRLERRDSHEISLLDSDRSSSKPNMDWKPSSWFLRTKAHERRHSGDVSEYVEVLCFCDFPRERKFSKSLFLIFRHQAHFQKRLMHLHQRLRRRKSISEETLQLVRQG